MHAHILLPFKQSGVNIIIISGASGDFQTATRIATAMVKKLGMSEKVNLPLLYQGLVFIQTIIKISLYILQIL